MFDFTIYKDNNPEKFKKACALIEQHYPQAQKEQLLVDVDGSTIQIYYADNKKIGIYDDYDVGAVYVKAEIDLNEIFN